MKYIIKNLETGEYLRQGDTFFVWTSDIYYARVFKGLKGATTVLNNILMEYLGLEPDYLFDIFNV